MTNSKPITPCVHGGYVCMPVEAYNQTIEIAAQRGAEVALKQQDAEIIGLIAAIRSAKSTIWQTIWRAMTTTVLVLLLAGLYTHFGGK